MNPVAAVEAAAREPLATLSAIAERLSQPHEGGDFTLPRAPELVLPGLPAALAEVAALQAGQVSALDAAQAEALATAQAQQGRLTLGQMAQQATASQAHALDAGVPGNAGREVNTMAAQASAPQLASASAAALPAGASLLAVPVLLSPMQMQPGTQTARNEAVKPEPLRQQERQPQFTQEDSAQEEPRDDSAAPATDDASPAAPTPMPDAQALLALLRQHASAEVQRDLQAGRRVLVVLPRHAPERSLAPAPVVLLGPGGVRVFASCRWWPGTGTPAAIAASPWPQWRVFREGDPLHAPVLVSRSAGHSCRVLLGSAAPRLLDSRTALLELAERLRFMQALGGQWSLLLLVAPTGLTL